MKKNLDTPKLLKEIFAQNWKESFIFDASEDRVISYEDFLGAVLNYKEKLKNFGFKKDDTVCLLIPNSLDLIILYFACLIMQMTVVPINPNKGKEEIKEILSQVPYKAVICEADGVNFPCKKIKIAEFRAALCKKSKVNIDKLGIFDAVNYNKLFLISFTSGSTGIPKGVMHSFNNLVLGAIAFNKRFSFGENSIFYHNLPMTYMAGILNLIILPFISMSKIVIGDPFSISNVVRFWDLPIKYSANVFWFVPTIISILLKLDRGTKGIEYAANTKIIGCVGTAHLNEQLKESFEEKYEISLYESYGLSETLFVATNFPGRPHVKDSAGEVLDDARIFFSKESEIIINVPWMFLGYSNVKTEHCFEGKSFLSGDIGKIIEDGSIFITSRKKDLINKGGINISPRRIENFIERFGILEECAIIGLEDITLGEKIVCFFVPKTGVLSNTKKKELNNEIIDKLGKDYRIDEFIKIEKIPKTPTGKINKHGIKEMYKAKVK